jgi:hypothetical protein
MNGIANTCLALYVVRSAAKPSVHGENFRAIIRRDRRLFNNARAKFGPDRRIRALAVD